MLEVKNQACLCTPFAPLSDVDAFKSSHARKFRPSVWTNERQDGNWLGSTDEEAVTVIVQSIPFDDIGLRLRVSSISMTWVPCANSLIAESLMTTFHSWRTLDIIYLSKMLQIARLSIQHVVHCSSKGSTLGLG